MTCFALNQQEINQINEVKMDSTGPDGDDNDVLAVTVDIVPVALATGSFRSALSESGIHRPSTASCHLLVFLPFHHSVKQKTQKKCLLFGRNEQINHSVSSTETESF